MAYVDANFQYTLQDTVIGGGPAIGVGLGTVTASATQTYTGTVGSQVNGTFRLPVFKTPTIIKGIRVYCTAAAGSGVTGISLAFMNGTGIVGSCVAPVVGTFTDVIITSATLSSNGAVNSGSSPSYFTTTNNEMTMLTTATGTASGSSLGSYSVDLIWNNLFTT
jgi:hypothetical protein